MSNRLIHETSPYLLQHAHNPVDWYPWGEEALAAAVAQNKPILVSIGYSACHWCHVMERESFENADTAAIMNRHFINIKIDREERPDLDHIYMDAVQTISGSGGWPLNVFLTPHAKPFYGGTYFPPVQAYNRSSWREVLHAINQAWTEKPHELISQAENLTEHLRSSNMFSTTTAATAGSEADLVTITDNLLKNADTVWGGFGRAPKFPQTFSITFLLRQYYYEKRKGKPASGNAEKMLAQALLSLDKMIQGGIYDQLAGGFARYSVDNEWLAPHFEKMLYDNALLVSVLCEAYQLTQDEKYRSVIEQTLDFVRLEWLSPEGGFYSAYDADSEGVEGKFYTWSKKEVEKLIGDAEKASLFCSFYDITEAGNFEETNILRVLQPLPEFCTANQLDITETADTLRACRAILLEARNKRVKPGLDDKMLLGWNALMITAFCKAGAALDNDGYTDIAQKAATYINSCMRNADGRLQHNYKGGKASNPAFLDDLAFYIEALIALQEVTGNFGYLFEAASLTQLVLNEFRDAETGYFCFTPAWQKDVIFRKKDVYDGAMPSGNAIMVENLLKLSILTDNIAWRSISEELITKILPAMLKYPGSFGVWAHIFQFIIYGMDEIAVLGNEAKNVAKTVLRTYIPGRLLQFASISDNRLPLLKEKNVTPGNVFIFLCYNYSCRQPVKSVGELVEILQ